MIDNRTHVKHNINMDIDKFINVRIQLDDPAGYPIIEQVSVVPEVADENTAYRTGNNLYFDGELNALKLRISDQRIDNLITAHGEAAAVCRGYRIIAATLSGELKIARTSFGADVIQWQPIADLYNIYRQLAADCKEQQRSDEGNNTGRYGQMKQPTIVGGLL
jgi:hypothetical protein